MKVLYLLTFIALDMEGFRKYDKIHKKLIPVFPESLNDYNFIAVDILLTKNEQIGHHFPFWVPGFWKREIKMIMTTTAMMMIFPRTRCPFLCMLLHFSTFHCISLRFTAFFSDFSVFLCMSLHLSAFLCFSLHFSAFLCISLPFTFYILRQFDGAYPRPLDAIFYILSHIQPCYTFSSQCW